MALQMSFEGAVVKEQGVTFAIALVNDAGWIDPEGARAVFRRFFADLPLVLAHQDPFETFEYQGRRDLVDFLASIDPAHIPWRQYTVS